MERFVLFSLPLLCFPPSPLTPFLPSSFAEREKQKSFVVIEEPRDPKPLRPPKTPVNGTSSSARMNAGPSPEQLAVEEQEYEEEEEEEEKFDIDE